jgi:hypothetical protein
LELLDLAGHLPDLSLEPVQAHHELGRVLRERRNEAGDRQSGA